MHGLLLGLLLARPSAKAVLMALLLVTACATYYMQSYGVYLDDDMLRNVLHTEWSETRELVTPGLALHLMLYAGIPCALVLWIKVEPRPVSQALLVRGGWVAHAPAAREPGLVEEVVWMSVRSVGMDSNSDESRARKKPDARGSRPRVGPSVMSELTPFSDRSNGGIS